MRSLIYLLLFTMTLHVQAADRRGHNSVVLPAMVMRR